MIKNGELTEEATQLIDLGKELEKEGYELSTGSGPNRKINKELVARLVKARKSNSLKKIKDTEFLKKILKMMFKKKSFKSNSKAKSKKEHGINSTDFLEKELARAIFHLRSSNSIDSDANDLRILEDMAKITMLVSTLSGRGSKNIDLARQSMNNYSLTTGGASLEGAVTRQALRTNSESIEKSMRYHLDHQTSSVNISTLPITEEVKRTKEIANQKYMESVQALQKKEGK